MIEPDERVALAKDHASAAKIAFGFGRPVFVTIGARTLALRDRLEVKKSEYRLRTDLRSYLHALFASHRRTVQDIQSPLPCG